MDSIVDLLSEQRKMIFSVTGGPQRGQMHHRRVMDAIVAKDIEAARNCMRAHLNQVRADTRHAIVSDTAQQVNLP
jgi:DNA-binding GntR family transcriptional regulator